MAFSGKETRFQSKSGGRFEFSLRLGLESKLKLELRTRTSNLTFFTSGPYHILFENAARFDYVALPRESR